MSVACLDTSFVVAIALGERGSAGLTRRLAAFTSITASLLVEAELRSTLRREARATDVELLERIEWILPNRSLASEVERVLDAGYVRGADCMHLASALYASNDPATRTFLTLDSRQRAVAKTLGFKT